MNGWAERRRRGSDQLKYGKLYHRPWEGIVENELGAFNQSIVLFRGTFLQQECLDDWEDMVECQKPDGSFDAVRLQGYTAFFETLNIALSYLAENIE